MIVSVFCKDVKTHPPKELLQILPGIPRQDFGQLHQRMVVLGGLLNVLLQDGGRREHVNPLSFPVSSPDPVKSAHPKETPALFRGKKPGLRHGNSTVLCTQRVFILHFPCICVIGRSRKLDNPVFSPNPGHDLGSGTSAGPSQTVQLLRIQGRESGERIISGVKGQSSPSGRTHNCQPVTNVQSSRIDSLFQKQAV